MHPYRIALMAFAVTLLIFVMIIAVICSSDRMPAPRISPSYSFNEKALWLRKTLRREPQVDILIVGSSMGLNNINGAELARITGTDKIVNASSWGLPEPVAWRLTKTLLDRIQPRVVILPVYYGDFQQPVEEPDWSAFKQLLTAWSEVPLYLENPEGNYYREHYGDQSSPPYLQRQVYDSLVFDPYGCVPLNPDHFQRNTGRWEKYKTVYPSLGPSREAMDALREMATTLRERKITFILVVCPIRQVAEEKFAEDLQSLFWNRIKLVTEESKGVFIQISSTPDFDDSLFVDVYHLNANGSKNDGATRSGVKSDLIAKITFQ